MQFADISRHTELSEESVFKVSTDPLPKFSVTALIQVQYTYASFNRQLLYKFHLPGLNNPFV